MDDTLYDEFGNYIGPELDSSEDEKSDQSQSDSEHDSDNESLGDGGFCCAILGLYFDSNFVVNS